MEIRDLYNLVLTVGLVGLIGAVVVVTLVSLMASTGVTGTVAATFINNTINAMLPIGSTWLPLIVTVAVLSIILVLVIRSFGGAGR